MPPSRRRRPGPRMPKDLIQRLEAADIERTGKALAAERGLEWRPAVPGKKSGANSL
jgi:hypothetical protein